MDHKSDYLGDGVYAEHDGFGIWLRANAPDSESKVYLEPAVFNNLKNFAERCNLGK